MPEALDLEEEEDVPVPRPESGQRLLENHAQRGVAGRVDGRGRHPLFGEHLGLVPPAASLPADVVAGVDEDAVHPGAEPRRALEGAHTAIHAQEGLLHRVLGVGGAAQDVVGHTLHARPMAPIELLEGGDLAAPAALDEVRLGRGNDLVPTG